MFVNACFALFPDRTLNLMPEKKPHPLFQRVVVVGGTGCGGRAVVSALRRAGHQVLSIARGQNKPKPDVICDRHDEEELKKILSDFQPNVVVDHVAYSPQDVESLLSSLPPSVHRYIFISSAMIYGSGGGSLYTESDTPHPEGMFAISKLGAETKARQWATQGRETISLRLGWLYGPGHAPLTPLGRDPSLLKRLAQRETILLPLEDHPAIQPWFAEDHGSLISNLVCTKNPPEALNVAAEKRYSWRELMEAWAVAANCSSPRFERCSNEELTTRSPQALRPFLQALLNPPCLNVERLQQTAFGSSPQTSIQIGFRRVLSWMNET